MTIKSRIGRFVGQQNPIRKGSVTGVTEGSIFVSSPVGLKEFQVSNPSAYKVGDLVKFQGNTYLGRIPSTAVTKIFVV